jgi:pre-mRNA-splicing factor SYF1
MVADRAQTEQKFWEIWKEFEVRHGNVETFKEMLRIKRSVTAQYSIAVQMPLAPAPSAEAGQEDPLQRLEAEASTGPALGKRFVGGSTLRPEELGLAPSETGVSARPATTANTEEIELDLDEGEEPEPQEEPAPSDKHKKRVDLEEIRVPQAVFGGLVEDASQDAETDAQGAKDRLKKRKRGPNH